MDIDNVIKKWTDIRDNSGKDNGHINCFFCQKYYNRETLNCGECPIVERTGKQHCDSTPYVEWKEHIKEKHDNKEKKIYCNICEEIVQKEIDFLKSL